MGNMNITHTNIYNIKHYASHLKSLSKDDRHSRFGSGISDFAIDELMLKMVYNHKEHELWVAIEDGQRMGWGHLCKVTDTKWELAVSVDAEHQRKGIANALMYEMLYWAKTHGITEVFMHCINSNTVIQHLARKHNLKTVERDMGERTAAIELPEPTLFETGSMKLKEQGEILKDFGRLQRRLLDLWKIG